MKTLTLRYKNYDKSIAFGSIREAINNNGKVETDVFYFNDLTSMNKFLSSSRTEILAVIKTEKPHSIYDLAQKLGKDQAYVSKEVKLLKELGVIDLISEKHDGRECLVPVLKFDRVVFDISFEEMPHFLKASSQ